MIIEICGVAILAITCFAVGFITRHLTSETPIIRIVQNPQLIEQATVSYSSGTQTEGTHRPLPSPPTEPEITSPKKESDYIRMEPVAGPSTMDAIFKPVIFRRPSEKKTSPVDQSIYISMGSLNAITN
jgi:hypothetical protein